VGVVGEEGGWTTVSLADALERRTGFRLVIDMEKLTLDTVSDAVTCNGLDLRSLDGVVIKKIGKHYSPHLLDRLEMLHHVNRSGVPVFTEPWKIYRLIDRLSCTLNLLREGIPMPPTVITEDVACAVRTVQAYGEAVLKPLYSSKARGMRVLEAGDSTCLAEQIREFQSEGNPVLYIQKKVEVPGRDLGVTFLDGKHVGTYARMRGKSSSWNTTIHHGGRYGPYEPSDEIIELARRAQAIFDLHFSSVDVAETPEGPVVFEVSAFGGFRGLWEGPRVDAADLLAEYVVAKLAHA
jgi:ribosomal protein S6--L-glutamate ligase